MVMLLVNAYTLNDGDIVGECIFANEGDLGYLYISNGNDGYFYLWNIFSKVILEDIFLKKICFNIFLKRIFDTNICLVYDKKAHDAEWLYKEDSYPSFIHQFNSIELSLLGFLLVLYLWASLCIILMHWAGPLVEL